MTDWEYSVAAAADHCVDPNDIDVGHLAQLARGEPLREFEASVMAHLARCPHCRVVVEELKELYAPGAMPPMPVEPRPADTEERPLVVPLPRRRTWATAVASLAALALVGVAIPEINERINPPAPLPGLQIAMVKGSVAKTMGAEAAAPDIEPLRFAPTGTVSLVARLDAELPEGSPAPQLASFYADEQRALRAVPMEYVEAHRSPGWVSHTLTIPVRNVFGTTPGARTLVFCVAYDRPALTEIEGTPLSTLVDANEDRRCARRALEVVEFLE